ncbi:MAG: hypothetical protein RL685_2638 [Pseudomonadota bacterium]|jgi:hypothetical protein
MRTRRASNGGWLAVARSLACGLSLLAAPAEAAEPGSVSEAQRRAAELFREGRQQLEQGDLSRACESFRASLEVSRSPGTLLNLGRCREAEGDAVLALVLTRQALAESAGESDPAKRQAWLRGARIEVLRLERLVARVQRPAQPGWQLRIDGKPWEALHREGDDGAIALLNPGQHEVEFVDAEGQSYPYTLALAGGETHTPVPPVVKVVGAPAAASSAPAPGAVAPSPSGVLLHEERAEEAASSRAWPVVLMSLGGVLIGGGAAAGIITAGKAEDLKSTCPNRDCQGNARPLESANRWGTATNVLWIAGVATLGAGITWYWLGSEASDDGELARTAQLRTHCGLASCGAELTLSF